MKKYSTFKTVCAATIPLLLMFASVSCDEGSIKTAAISSPQHGKITAPITLQNTRSVKASVGETVSVPIEFEIRSDAVSVSLELTEGKGLNMVSDGSRRDYGPQSSGSIISHTVDVTPQTEGILYLNVFVTGDFGGHIMSSSGAVAITVGEGKERQGLMKPGSIQLDSKGDAILSMPAQERK